MKSCPRCGIDLEVAMPKRGEVWLRVETGHLYRIVEEPGYIAVYGGAERVRPPRAGCDVTFAAAVWPEQVRNGAWLRIENPSAEDLASLPSSTGGESER